MTHYYYLSELETVCAVTKLPYLLKDTPVFISNKGKTPNIPHIQFDTDNIDLQSDTPICMSLYVDTTRVLDTGSIFKAVIALVGAYYIFNVAYVSKGANKCLATLTFMQKHMLEIHDSLEIPEGIIRLLDEC